MYKNIFLSIFFSFIFSIGDMPKAWKMPSTYEFTKPSIIGDWSIDVNKIIDEFRLSDEYKNAGEYGELSVQMIEQIFVDMKFNFSEDKTYTIFGIPNQETGNSNFEGFWYEKNGIIHLESPDPTNVENLTFKFNGDDVLEPISKKAGNFYLLRD